MKGDPGRGRRPAAEVDQDDRLWSLVEDLPVVADPILAAVAPDVAVEADEDAILEKVRMRALPLFVVWLAAPTLSLMTRRSSGASRRGLLPPRRSRRPCPSPIL